MRSIFARLPSKYFRSEIMTSSHKPRAFKSRTRYAFISVDSPNKFELTYRFWYVGSIQAETPMMLEIVAVGAIATQLELRMPNSLMRARNGAQSKVSL